MHDLRQGSLLLLDLYLPALDAAHIQHVIDKT